MELTLDQALQRGIAAHKEGKLQDAERLYRAILQSQPTHPDANHNLGVLAVSVNKAEAALPLFKAALEANPKIEQFWLSYIDALIKIERFDAVRQVLTDAQQAGVAAAKLQIFEEQLQSEFSLGSHTPQRELGSSLECHQDLLLPAIELREVGKYKEAQEWLNDFIEQNSDNVEALSLLSQILLLDKKEVEAEIVLTAAASIKSELPSIYRNQARLLLKQAKKTEALEKAQLACKQSPEDLESLLVLAACLKANQRDSEALPIIEKILEAEPNHAEAYANRALIKLRAKDTVGAIEDAKMTVSLKPHFTQTWFLLSTLYYQDSNLIDAIKALRRAHENEPENPVFMTQLGEFLRQDNKASEAINILEQATKLAPEDASAWTNLGVVFQQEKRIADAKIAYKKALAFNPESAAVASNLGAMAQDANDLESALRYFEKALEIDPNLAEAHYNLGKTLQELGRLDEAEASYTQAIVLKSDFAYALYKRSQLLIDKAQYEAALIDAEACTLKKARALTLISLYALGRVSEVYERLKLQSKSDAENISLAAFASFISEVEEKPTAYNFCPNPIDFINIANLSSHVNDSVTFLGDVIEELNKIETMWEPAGRATVSGFQSLSGMNLFKNPTGKIAQLKTIIINEIETYYLKFKNEQCSYIQKFPTIRNLFGWTVILKQQGHQSAHIHPSGWLSGVIYLKVVPALGKDEGAIEFSLNGKNYSDFKSPKLLHQPAQGDIVFFPSSLHHRTIPFTTDADRISVSFDLIPEVAKH